jgi:hypothetical protein
MTIETINIGTAANDGSGDPLRTAFSKTNANFSELYSNTVTLSDSQTISNKAFVFPQSGATSAYATKRVLQYNESTGAVTYSNSLDAVRPYITGYSSEIHVSPVAFDDTGNGTIGDPVKTIAQAQVLAAAAFETTGAGQRKTIVLHPGDYAENVTIDTQFTVLTTHELVGKNTTLSGTLTITKGCTIDGLKMTNLVISATSAFGSVDIIGCTVTTAATKTSTAYVNFRGCDLSSATLNITGAGSTVMGLGNYGTVTVNNTSAGVLAKAVITMGPVTLTAGTMQISDTLVYAATNTSNAITQSAGSVLTLNNSQTLIPALTGVARNSFGGFYSILHSIYDKANSTFGGTSLAAISYSQYINADRVTLNGSTSGSIILNANAIAGSTTLTLPGVTDTLVGRTTTDTLTVNLGTVSSNVNSIAANVSNILSGTTSFSGNKTFTDNVGIGIVPSAKLDIAEVWNNVSTTFTAIRANVTDTASAAGSLLLDLQVAGASKFRVGKDGQVSAGSFMMGSSPESTTSMSGLSRNGNNLLVNTVGTQAFNFATGAFISSRPIALGASAYAADVVLNRDAADILAQRNGVNPQTHRIYNTYTDASNYERGVIGWSANALQIGTEALGTGTRRPININYTTTIDGFARVNVPVLTLSNVGAGNGGLLVGALSIGYTQDQPRVTAFDTANKALAYSVRGSAVSGQGAHRFSGDAGTGTSVGANGSIVDIVAPSTATNIFQARQATETVVFNVAYSGAITIANTVTSSTEATTLATVTKTQIASFPVASFRSGKLLVQAYDTITGATQISEILLAHNVNSASHTEYGIVFTGATSIVAYDVDIVSANVRLMATRTTTNSTQYKISETLIAS